MFKNIFKVSIATILSRILGYIRDMLIAYNFGCSIYTDAFFVAFRIPNLLRQLLGEGTLSSSFIPVFTHEYSIDGKEVAKKTANYVFFLIIMLTSVLVIIGEIFAPFIVRIIAPGFVLEPEKFHLTVKLTRIMFPIMCFISLAAVVFGISNSLKYFFIPALAPTMMNITVIIYFVIFSFSQDKLIKGLGFAVLTGIFLEFLFPLFIPIKEKILSFRFIRSPFKMLKDKGVLKIIMLMLPATVGIAVYQFNAFVDTICASLLREGSVSALYYSLRLTHLPLALFGISVATVTLPYLSEDNAKKNMDKFFVTFENGIYYIFLFILPATVGIIYLAEPIIKVLFERGQFNQNSVLLTKGVLRFYASGLLFFAGVRILTASFYAMKDTKTPVKTASVSLFVNLFLNIIFMFKMEAKGLALATSIASFFNFIYLFLLLRKKLNYKISSQLFLKIVKIVVATLFLFLFLRFFPSGKLNIYLKLSSEIFGGALVYIIVCHFLKVLPFSLKSYIKRV